MRAGTLREQLVLQRRVDTRDAAGQPIAAWSDLATVWGAVEPEKGQEYFASQQLQAVSPVRFRIRYYAGLTPNDRVSWGGAVYNVKAVVDTYARRREMHVYCDTGLNQG